LWGEGPRTSHGNAPPRIQHKGIIKDSIWVRLGVGLMEDDDWAVFLNGDWSTYTLCGNGLCTEPYHVDISTKEEQLDRRSCRNANRGLARPACVGHTHHRKSTPCAYTNSFLTNMADKVQHYWATQMVTHETFWKMSQPRQCRQALPLQLTSARE
jgi:hypothetical protein